MAKKKILVIDFDVEFVKFLSRSLMDEGYEVITANDGLSGFEKFSENHPDLVITEAMLPKFHGFELCSRITSHPTKKAPVIIVTGIYKDTAYKTEALKSLGASAYFEKPINLEELLNKVYELIGKPESKKIVSSEEDLDKLLNEALSTTKGQKSTTRIPSAPEKTVKTEGPVHKAPTAKEDEVDLILKSKLKDIFSETEKAEAKTKTAQTVRPGQERLSSGPKEAEKTAPVLKPETPKTEQGEKIAKETSPAQPKPEPVKVEATLPEPETELKPGIKAEPKIEQKPQSTQAEKKSESVSIPTIAPTFSPFDNLYGGKEEEESKKKSSGKFIGIAAAALIIIAAVAFLTMKKKEPANFSQQPGNQTTAALQTTDTNQPTAQPSSNDLNQEIERQMASYRNQKAQSAEKSESSGAKNNQNSSAASNTPNRIESRPPAVAPIIPKQTPQLALNTTTTQTSNQPISGESGQAETSPAAPREEPKASENEVKEQPSTLPQQKVQKGDLVPLSMVDVEPRVIKTVEPVYPEADRRMGIKGSVILNVLISETGDVLDVAVIRGVRGSVALEKEAINAVKKWKFLPAEKDGVKVKVWKPITIGFGLNK